MKIVIMSTRHVFNKMVPLAAVLFLAGHHLVGQNTTAVVDQPASWSVQFKDLGIFSSPRVTDLNGDGTGDIVFGTGRQEFQPCDSAVIALDGRNGQVLWTVSSVDHLFTSAALKDLNGDGAQDVLMAGRSAEFLAINGKTGKLLWKFDKSQGDVKWYNFYSPQFIADQDGDGVGDILVSNGGNVMIAPFDPNRPTGNLLVLSGLNGKLLARAPMPDGKEIYMSVVALPTADGDYKVVFGSGGETIGGHLYVATLSEIMRGDLSGAKVLAACPDKGYIAPPLWVDITGDGHHDIVANAVEGKLLAFDGLTYAPLWSVKMENTEAYSSIAPGYFTGEDKVPDFFVTYAVGTWPDLGWSKQFMVNGATGKVAFVDSIGYYQTSTPVVIDFDNDGIDEAILNANVQGMDEKNLPVFYNVLYIMDFKRSEVLQVWDEQPGSNLASTPWIGDLDNDGLLDIVYCHGTNTRKTYSFTGIRINRIDTGIPFQPPVRWNGYMGNRYDGIFDGK